MLEGTEGLLEGPYSLAIGRPFQSLLPSLPRVGQGLVPRLPAEGVVRQQFGLSGDGIGKLRLQHLGNALMIVLTRLSQERRVGRLLYQCVLEHIDGRGANASLVQ